MQCSLAVQAKDRSNARRLFHEKLAEGVSDKIGSSLHPILLFSLAFVLAERVPSEGPRSSAQLKIDQAAVEESRTSKLGGFIKTHVRWDQSRPRLEER